MVTKHLGWQAAVAFLLTACGSLPTNHSLTPPSVTLDQALADLHELQTPPGVDENRFQSLKSALEASLVGRGVQRFAAAAPAGSLNAVSDLRLVEEGGKWYLRWTYVNVGDADQNSEVNISDLTPLGQNYGLKSGTVLWDKAQLADIDSNGEVNISDITPIGKNFMSMVAGYEVFGSADLGDHPSNNGGNNGPGTISLGFIDFDAASKGTSNTGERLRFSLEVVPSAQNPYYWVTPVVAQGGAGGIASLASGGDPTILPTLTLTNPPTGAGTTTNPYQADVQTVYALQLTDPVDGDVSGSPETRYFLSDPYAAPVGRNLDIADNFSGEFSVWATYKGKPLAAGGQLYFHVEGQVQPSDLVFTAWVPTHVTGSGTQTDPYFNPSLWQWEHMQTDLSVVDPVDGEVASQATFVVSPPVAEVHMDWADDLALSDDALNWGAFTVTATYKGKQARLYFDITRALQMTLTNPPAQGSGTAADPYLGDIDTLYDVQVTNVTDGTVSGAGDDAATGAIYYTVGDTYQAPEDVGYVYGNWVEKDTANNTCATGFQDSFMGGPTRPVWLYAHYYRDRVDGQGTPYQESSFTNRVYMILDPPPALMPPDQFIMYKDDQGAAITFYDTMWLNDTEGYGTRYDGSQWETTCEVYHTVDSGATWTLVKKVDGANGGQGASMWLRMWPDQMWYSTYFSGWGIGGTAGYSLDNAANWTEAAAGIQTAWDDDPTDGILPSFPIANFTRTNYGQAGDRLWVEGGEYHPYIAYTDDIGGGPHTWWGWRDIGLSWVSILGVGSELLVKGQDSNVETQFKRFDPGTNSFVLWEAAFPADCDKANCWWDYSHKSSVLTLLRTNTAPRYIFTTADGGRTLQTIVHQPTDPGKQDVLPLNALSPSDGTVYMYGYKSEGTMTGGFVGQRQVLKTTDGGNTWQLLLSQYAGWGGVADFDIGLEQDYTGGVHMTRRLDDWGRSEYGRYPTALP